MIAQYREILGLHVTEMRNLIGPESTQVFPVGINAKIMRMSKPLFLSYDKDTWRVLIGSCVAWISRNGHDNYGLSLMTYARAESVT